LPALYFKTKIQWKSAAVLRKPRKPRREATATVTHRWRTVEISPLRLRTTGRRVRRTGSPMRPFGWSPGNNACAGLPWALGVSGRKLGWNCSIQPKSILFYLWIGCARTSQPASELDMQLALVFGGKASYVPSWSASAYEYDGAMRCVH
jgi:hypothetical protein